MLYIVNDFYLTLIFVRFFNNIFRVLIKMALLLNQTD